MSVDELFAQLKDIKEPLQPGWWPLAPGWWYLLGIILLIIFIFYLLKKRRIAYGPFISANAELQRLKALYSKDNDAGELAFALSQWLKRVALYAFPEQQPAGLTGQAWLEFLDQNSGDTTFTQGAGQVFSSRIYDGRDSLNGNELLDVCERWLIAIKPQLIGQDLH